MKKSELRQIIKEEIKRVLKEGKSLGTYKMVGKDVTITNGKFKAEGVPTSGGKYYFSMAIIGKDEEEIDLNKDMPKEWKEKATNVNTDDELIEFNLPLSFIKTNFTEK